jgi:phytoene dehydrogenase-like protein
MKTVSIFGAGISGLTTAHELNRRGYDVTVYEKLDSPGGVARSKRVEGGLRSVL